MYTYIDEEALDFRDPRDRETILQKRRDEKLQRLQEIKERNKTYLKGRRGVRYYYDYDKMYEYDKNDNMVRKVKCVYTRDLRRQKLFLYLKYLNGRKVLVRDLAWKFAVTERTIQSDLKYLIENNFIERKINKTYLNRQTKNSYIVNKDKEKDLAFGGDCYVHPVLLAKQNNDYYILTQTDYDESKVIRGKVNIEYFTFDLPQQKIKNFSKIDKQSFTIAGQIFGKDITCSYFGPVYSYISNGKAIDEISNKVYDRWSEKSYFTLMILDELYPPQQGYRWITLKVAPRRIKMLHINKGVHYITKNILGVK